VKPDNDQPGEERSRGTDEEPDKGIAEDRRTAARSTEEGPTIVINEDCTLRFSRGFEGLER